MMIIMGSVSAADDIHYYTYTASGTTVTEKCSYHSSYSATATLAVDTSVSTKYNGGEIKAAKVVYSNGFEGDPFEIVYTNNVNVGKATATIERNGVSASVEFNIEKGSRNAPSGLSASAETVLGKGDGKINGLTTEMQISRDGGSTFANVTDTAMKLPAGDYYVRYGESASFSASASVKLTVKAGNPLTITFKADGKTVATKTVSYNGTLTDIPAVPTKTGYDQTAPKWDRASFTGITTNLTVNAVYTVNKYTVTFVADGKTVSTVTVEHGKTVTNPPTVPAKSGYNGAWESKVSQGVTANVTVNAVYTEVSTQSTTTTTPPVTSTTPEDTTTPESSETQTESTESATVTDPVETSPDVTESETESDGMTSPVTTDGENDPSGEKQPYDVTAIVIVSSLAVVTAIAVTVIIVSKRKK